MKSHRSLTGLAIICLAASLLGACGHSPRVTYYTLNGSSGAGSAETSSTAYSVLVGPVTIPELYDRPQLVMRLDTNRVEILESHRWASPLKTEIPRILAEDLAAMIKQARFSAYPQNAGQDAEFRILIDIQRFDMIPGKGIDFETLWTIRRHGELLKRGTTSVREPASGTANDVLVAAYDRALAAVSRDIATYLSTQKHH